jgi:GNAT superfamily N-acetyltransferase
LHTYYLGKEEVAAYLANFARHLSDLAADYPRIWFPVGVSGEKIARDLLLLLKQNNPGLYSITRIIPVTFNRDRGTVGFGGSKRSQVKSSNRNALVLDSSIHSGSTMRTVVEAVQKWGFDTCCYCLVLKRGSSFVPNMFGVMIGDHDRAYFQLDEITNSRSINFGIVRALDKHDVSKPPLRCDVPSLDKVDWSDLWYDMATDGRQVYVVEERGRLAAYISFHIKSGDHAIVDAVVRDKSSTPGLGGDLLRWVETQARSRNCRSIKLWAIKARVDYYKGEGFEEDGGIEPLKLAQETYIPMTRRLLYNLPEDPEC